MPPPNTNTNPPIAIIGAGPAGLTLAALLTLHSIPYTLFERSATPPSPTPSSSPSSPSRAGGSLDIHPSTGQLALREAGLFDEFQRFARYEDTVVSVFDKAGRRVFGMGQGRDAPEIDRGELTRVLLGAVPEGSVKWGWALERAERGGDGRVELRFGGGEVLSGWRLVVGADGAWSQIRKLITDATPTYSNRSYLEGRINRDNPLWDSLAQRAGAGMSMTVGDKKLILTQRQGDGSYRTYFGLEVPENFFRSDGINLEDLDSTRELLAGFFTGWADEYQQMIRHSSDFRAWRLCSLAVDDIKWKSVPDATLIGDAAHLSIPNGEGVNLAMADALDLAKKIAEHGLDGLDKAVEEYEAGMFPRGAQSVSEGLGMADYMFADGPGPFVDLMKSYGAVDE
ncbi:hypothetical protein F5144DRAFT_333768 [Chaetomium tenue]|uniref:Uncharacterized protein n=1 Tax=Chaetomium tenue TaxID=1854479 RepID=A0ACB7P1Q5_9PEZI|nr:hypothetical protein F5144DRAFT_333768 [Chaetomium globosum]